MNIFIGDCQHHFISPYNHPGRDFSRWFRYLYDLKNGVAKTIVANIRQGRRCLLLPPVVLVRQHYRAVASLNRS